jgi:putative addiction module component (TIGR02574 family)
MSPSERLLDEALALPRAERSRLLAALVASLDDAAEDINTTAKWASDIARRVAHVRAGSNGIDAAEVHAQVRAALRSR